MEEPGVRLDVAGFVDHGQYRALFERLIAEGHMRSTEPAADLDRLVVTSIVVWTSWVAHLSALRPVPRSPERTPSRGLS